MVCHWNAIPKFSLVQQVQSCWAPGVAIISSWPQNLNYQTALWLNKDVGRGLLQMLAAWPIDIEVLAARASQGQVSDPEVPLKAQFGCTKRRNLSVSPMLPQLFPGQSCGHHPWPGMVSALQSLQSSYLSERPWGCILGSVCRSYFCCLYQMPLLVNVTQNQQKSNNPVWPHTEAMTETHWAERKQTDLSPESQHLLYFFSNWHCSPSWPTSKY